MIQYQLISLSVSLLMENHFKSISSEQTSLSLNNGKMSPTHPNYRKHISLLANKQAVPKVEILLLGWNNNPSIISILEKSPDFSRLQLLTLNGNNVQSLEGLQRLSMPTLIHLQICENNIISLKPLRKIHMPKLRQLNLSGQKVVDRDFIKFSECQWQNLSALIINLKSVTFREMIKTNFYLDFGMYGSESTEAPKFMHRRFPKTVQNNYNFVDFLANI